MLCSLRHPPPTEAHSQSYASTPPPQRTPPPVTKVTHQPEITALAVDATNVFWATFDGTNGAIFTTAK